MALDGMVIADMASELNRDLTGGRITNPSGRRKDTAQSEASCTFGQSESSVDL